MTVFQYLFLLPYCWLALTFYVGLRDTKQMQSTLCIRILFMLLNNILQKYIYRHN